MSILALFVWLVLIGLVVYLINAYVPLSAPFQRIILVVGILLAVLLVLSAFGLLDTFQSARVPQLR